MSQSNRCPYCDSKDIFESFELTNITNRTGDVKQINHEFTRCDACEQEFVTSQQARNNDAIYFGE